MCVLSIKVPIRKNSGNLSYAPRMCNNFIKCILKLLHWTLREKNKKRLMLKWIIIYRRLSWNGLSRLGNIWSATNNLPSSVSVSTNFSMFKMSAGVFSIHFQFLIACPSWNPLRKEFVHWSKILEWYLRFSVWGIYILGLWTLSTALILTREWGSK